MGPGGPSAKPSWVPRPQKWGSCLPQYPTDTVFPPPPKPSKEKVFWDPKPGLRVLDPSRHAFLCLWRSAFLHPDGSLYTPEEPEWTSPLTTPRVRTRPLPCSVAAGPDSAASPHLHREDSSGAHTHWLRSFTGRPSFASLTVLLSFCNLIAAVTHRAWQRGLKILM